MAWTPGGGQRRVIVLVQAKERSFAEILKAESHRASAAQAERLAPAAGGNRCAARPVDAGRAPAGAQ
jgi:hypothetical protein